jgi:hypothetical protein
MSVFVPDTALDEARKLASYEGWLDDQLKSARLRQVTIVSYNAGTKTATIRIGGATTVDVAGVKHLASYAPAAADTGVWALVNGTSVLLLGATGATGSGVLFARKSADESVTNSTAMQDDNHLVLTVDANSTYKMDCFIGTDGDDGSANGPNLKVTWTGPSGATMTWGHGRTSTNATFSTTIGGTIVYYFTGVGGVDSGLLLAGTLITSGTSGSLQFRWAQEVASLTATRVFTGSYLSLVRVA